MPEEQHNNQEVNSQCWETPEGERKRKKEREGEKRERRQKKETFAGHPRLPVLFSLFYL